MRLFLHHLALFDVGGTELLMIMLVTLLLFGSKRMPELARGLGKSIREFKKAASGFEEELKRAMEAPPPPANPAPPSAKGNALPTPPPPAASGEPTPPPPLSAVKPPSSAEQPFTYP